MGTLQRTLQLLSDHELRCSWLDRIAHDTKQENMKYSRWIQTVTSEDVEMTNREQSWTHQQAWESYFLIDFQKKVLGQGSVDSRIVWVRIDGPVCPLFIVCVFSSQIPTKSLRYRRFVNWKNYYLTARKLRKMVTSLS